MNGCAQEVFIVPATMPLTQLASTALDRVAPNIEATIEALLDYARTDLVCYRASEPDELVTAQSALLDPLLEWFEERTGQALIVARGVMPIVQQPQAIEPVRAVLSQKLPEVLDSNPGRRGISVIAGYTLGLGRGGRTQCRGGLYSRQQRRDLPAEQMGR